MANYFTHYCYKISCQNSHTHRVSATLPVCKSLKALCKFQKLLSQEEKAFDCHMLSQAIGNKKYYEESLFSTYTGKKKQAEKM